MASRREFEPSPTWVSEGGELLAPIESWFLRAGVFVLPLAFWWDTYDHYVLPKLLLARVLLLGLLILLVARVALSRTVLVRRTALDLPLLAFLVSALLSTLVASNQNVGIFGTYARYDGLLTTVIYAGLFWVTVQMLRGAGDVRPLVRVILVSGYAVAAVAIWQSVSDSVRDGAVAPASGTLGNPNVLGAFLAMLCPLAFDELLRARSWSARILSMNALGVIGIALLLTFSRSAWLGAAIAAAVVVAGARGAALRYAVVTVCIVAILIVGGRSVGSGGGLERLIGARITTIVDLSAWGESRLHIWRDTGALIASRPILGYGPDSFGLVFPGFETGDWGLGARDTHQQVDKAHAEVLQVSATQGLVGLAAYLLLLGAFIRACWRGRAREGLALFAAWVAYTVTVQLNFTALASAFPFWLLAAACLVMWEPTPATVSVALPRGSVVAAAGTIVIAGLAVLCGFLVVPAYLADADLQRAVYADASGSGQAAAWAARARALAPQESVYAVEAGNLAFERSHWVEAREAYEDAARLGTYNPLVYRNLALADRELGRLSEARTAARQALELDRFDPANQALVAQFAAPHP